MPFHDINDPGVWRPAGSPCPETTAVSDEPAGQPRKTKPQVRFISGAFSPHPVHGYTFNKPCFLHVKAEFLTDSASRTVYTSLKTTYDNETIDQGVNKTALLDDTGETTCEIPLYYHNQTHHQDDGDGTLKGPAIYTVTLTHKAATGPLEVTLEMPNNAGGPPLLRRGHFDDHGVENYNGYTTTNEDYLQGEPVFALQQMLNELRFAECGKADGVFGENTGTAMKNFQQFALEKKRLHGKSYKMTETTPRFEGPVDGIVGPKTRDELDVWKREGWIRPVLVLYPGDYDEEATSRGIRERGGEDFHEGKPVQRMQEKLQHTGCYENNVCDGDFGDQTLQELKKFQEWAGKGRFLIKDAIDDVPEKLKGHKSGVYDEPTQEFMETAISKGWKIPPSEGKTIHVIDENGEPFSDVTFKLPAGEKRKVEDGKVYFSEEMKDVELVFETVAMNTNGMSKESYA